MTAPPPQQHVLIVGGGIIGIACAHYLAKAGMRVTVIDRNRPGQACSHGNCGYICPSHILPLTEPEAMKVAARSLLNPNAPFRVKPTLRPSMINWMWQFAKRCNQRQMVKAGKHLQAILDLSIREFRQLMASEKLACEWTELGLLYVLQTERGMKSFAHTDEFINQHFGVAATHIAGPDLPDFDPAIKPGLAGGFHYPGDASLRPDLLNEQWGQRLTQHGVTFISDCALKSINKQAGRITGLVTSQGEMQADQYVLAVGAWSRKLSDELGCSIPVEPGKGYSVTMARPTVCPKYPMLFPEHKVGVSPFADGYRLGSMMEFVGYDTTIPQRRVEQLRQSAVPYLVEPFTETIQEQWFGWRPMTWDSLPIIGRTPGLGNAILATGHNMLGVTLAPATGKLVSEIILDEPRQIDTAAFSPDRFS